MKKLLLTIALAAVAAAAYGQGTVQFVNNAFQRFTLTSPTGARTNVPASAQINFGLFWGVDAAAVQAAINPLTPLGTMSTTPGVMAVALGTQYPIEGGQPGQRVFLQVRGWSASFGSDWRAAMAAHNAGVGGTIFGQTDIRQLGTAGLGPIGGPGVAIWQSAVGTNPNLFNPLQLFEAVPEPSVIALAIIGLGSLVFLRRRN